MNQPLILKGATLTMKERFLSAYDADHLLETLVAETPWEQRDVIVHGKSWPQPRLVAWYGNGSYTYSGQTMEPLPFTDKIAHLKHLVEHATGETFNSVLLNRYVAGQNHGIGMHSDNEPELGRRPLIAMVTLGEERALRFEPKPWIDDQPIDVPTPHGSLLIMAGDTQKNWKHGVAKRRGQHDRVTLTFRQLQTR